MTKAVVRESKVYSEEESSEILSHAAKRATTEPARTSGLTLAELETIAQDAGIDPQSVRMAATDLASSHAKGAQSERRVVAIERVVDGELTPASAESLAANLRSLFFRAGDAREQQLSLNPRSLSWTGQVRGSLTQISIVPERGKTVLRVEQERIEVEPLGFVASAIGLALGAGTGAIGALSLLRVGTFAEYEAPVFLALSATLSVGAGFLAYLSRLNRKPRTALWHRQLNELGDQLEREVKAVVAGG